MKNEYVHTLVRNEVIYFVMMFKFQSNNLAPVLKRKFAYESNLVVFSGVLIVVLK